MVDYNLRPSVKGLSGWDDILVTVLQLKKRRNVAWQPPETMHKKIQHHPP